MSSFVSASASVQKPIILLWWQYSSTRPRRTRTRAYSSRRYAHVAARLNYFNDCITTAGTAEEWFVRNMIAFESYAERCVTRINVFIYAPSREKTLKEKKKKRRKNEKRIRRRTLRVLVHHAFRVRCYGRVLNFATAAIHPTHSKLKSVTVKCTRRSRTCRGPCAYKINYSSFVYFTQTHTRARRVRLANISHRRKQ